jgi:hypothetical protein
MGDLPSQNIDFFTYISFLFYAIAASDKEISRKEKEEIMRVVDKHWNIKNTILSSKEIIFSTIKKLISEKTSAASAFDAFIEYLEANQTLFDTTIKKMLMESAYDIANAYAKRNKSELLYLSQLHQHLFST